MFIFVFDEYGVNLKNILCFLRLSYWKYRFRIMVIGEICLYVFLYDGCLEVVEIKLKRILILVYVGFVGVNLILQFVVLDLIIDSKGNILLVELNDNVIYLLDKFLKF